MGIQLSNMRISWEFPGDFMGDFMGISRSNMLEMMRNIQDFSGMDPGISFIFLPKRKSLEGFILSRIVALYHLYLLKNRLSLAHRM